MVARLVEEAATESITSEIETAALPAVRSGGARNLANTVRAVADLAESSTVSDLVNEILGSGHRLVRSILFDKTPSANWNLGWHQDVTIAVEERLPAPGFGQWTVKAGVVSVQPAAPVLERMITV